MKLIRELKLTKDVHEHFHKQGIITVDDLKAEVARQRASISDDAVCQCGCSDCEETLMMIWKEEQK